MESTKSTTIACVAGLLLAVPAWAQDRTHVNTSVELTEHVHISGQNEADAHGDPTDSGYGGEVQLAQAPAKQDQGFADEIEPTFEEYAGKDQAEDQAGLVADEEAYIPRGHSDETSGAVMRTAQTGNPWYRNPFTALLVVLGVIGVVAAVVRRWVPAARTVNSEQLQVVGRTAISSKQSVVLLHVGERVVLLGVTPDAVNTLSEITDGIEVARLLGRSKSNQAVQGNFDSVLTREFEQYEATEPVPTEEVEPRSTKRAAPTEVQQVATEASTSPVGASPTNGERKSKQNGQQSPSQLNDLLSRLRSLQKT